jgi:hypothetical protein
MLIINRQVKGRFQGIHIRALDGFLPVDGLNGDFPQRLNLALEEMVERAHISGQIRILRVTVKGQPPALALGDHFDFFSMIDQVGSCFSAGESPLDGINRNTAQRGGVHSVNPPYGFFGQGFLESSKGRMRDELEARKSVKEISPYNFTGQLHDPEGPK